VAVSAPCLDSGQLPMVPSDLRTRFPMTWAGDVGPLLPALTASELAAQRSAKKFTRCLKLGSASLLQQQAAPNGTALGRRLRVGLIVSATGTYLSWLDGLLASAEAYFLRSAEVHYFVLTDRESLDFEPRQRIHVLQQPLLGWPYDSMFRHQLYLKFREHFVGMDYLMVLDADVTFVSEVLTLTLILFLILFLILILTLILIIILTLILIRFLRSPLSLPALPTRPRQTHINPISRTHPGCMLHGLLPLLRRPMTCRLGEPALPWRRKPRTTKITNSYYNQNA